MIKTIMMLLHNKAPGIAARGFVIWYKIERAAEICRGSVSNEVILLFRHVFDIGEVGKLCETVETLGVEAEEGGFLVIGEDI